MERRREEQRLARRAQQATGLPYARCLQLIQEADAVPPSDTERMAAAEQMLAAASTTDHGNGTWRRGRDDVLVWDNEPDRESDSPWAGSRLDFDDPVAHMAELGEICADRPDRFDERLDLATHHLFIYDDYEQAYELAKGSVEHGLRRLTARGWPEQRVRVWVAGPSRSFLRLCALQMIGAARVERHAEAQALRRLMLGFDPDDMAFIRDTEPWLFGAPGFAEHERLSANVYFWHVLHQLTERGGPALLEVWRYLNAWRQDPAAWDEEGTTEPFEYALQTLCDFDTDAVDVFLGEQGLYASVEPPSDVGNYAVVVPAEEISEALGSRPDDPERESFSEWLAHAVTRAQHVHRWAPAPERCALASGQLFPIIQIGERQLLMRHLLRMPFPGPDE